jgi:hypothetical protein
VVKKIEFDINGRVEVKYVEFADTLLQRLKIMKLGGGDEVDMQLFVDKLFKTCQNISPKKFNS